MSGEVHALFSQYENEYCSKSTDLARKTQAIGSLSGGVCSASAATATFPLALSPLLISAGAAVSQRCEGKSSEKQTLT